MRHSRWRRAAGLLERWVRPLACLACTTGFYPEMAQPYLSSRPEPGDCDPAFDLRAQLKEILKTVAREELMWKIEDRIEGPSGRKSRPPASQP